jgi:hypothetical protein
MMTRAINFWGPFLGSGIYVHEANKDVTSITVKLTTRWFNKNIVGVHFGGSIYAMCDPFYMGILIHHLGQEYVVWDKEARVRFLKPGKGTLTAVFEIPLPVIAEIKAKADTHGKTEERFIVKVYSDDGIEVAEVEKIVWVRNKSMHRPSKS